MQTNRSASIHSGTVMEAADDLLTKAEELHALLCAEDDGMIPHGEVEDTRSPIVRAHTALLDQARHESETDEEVDARLEREAEDHRGAVLDSLNAELISAGEDE